MFERIWIHLQVYTIVALVNSPALLMLWTNSLPTQIIDHGPQSTATQEAPIEIYSIHIEPEETSSEEPTQKEDVPLTKKEEKTEKKQAQKSVKETPNKPVVPTSKAKREKTSPPKKPAKQKLPLSPKTSKVIKPSKDKLKRTKRSSRRRAARCSSVPNRRIQQISKNQFMLQKKVVHRYLGNLDNIKSLAKAYWYSGKRGEGILLRSIPCKSPLRNMGILPNDMIVSINGKKVENNLALVGHYFSLRSQKNVDIILKRQNRSLTLQYEIVKKLKKG